MGSKINSVDNIRAGDLNGILIVEFDVHYASGHTQNRYTKAYNSGVKPADLVRDVSEHIAYGLKHQESLENYGDVKFW